MIPEQSNTCSAVYLGCKEKRKTKIELVETGRILNWREICRTRKEWIKAVQEAKVHLGL
jgi:hypothetical protein